WYAHLTQQIIVVGGIRGEGGIVTLFKKSVDAKYVVCDVPVREDPVFAPLARVWANGTGFIEKWD
ncbi:hypothetical protein P7K49_039681, partial [Saguinus oedipus]